MKLFIEQFRRLMPWALIFLVIPQISLAQPSSNLNVTATIRPLHSITASIMEGVGAPFLLLGENQPAHDAVLKPSQVQMLAKADLLFWIGAQMETFLINPINTLAEKSRTIAVIDEANLQKLQLPGNSSDPHLWLSTGNALAIARLIKYALVITDPSNARKYQDNLTQFEMRLIDLEIELSSMLAAARFEKYLIYHNALGYFENQFDIDMRPVGFGNELLSASARQIRLIRTLALTDEYRCIFIDPSVNSAAVKSAVEGSKLRVVALDVIGTKFEAGADQYFAMMRDIASTIANCAK